MLCMAMLLACLGSAACCGAAPPGRETATDAALAEALAYFGAGPGPAADAGWQVVRLEAALEGAGFHRRRRYEVVLQRSSACDGAVGPSSGPAPAGERCDGASGVGEGPALAREERADAPSGRECCGASASDLGPALEESERVDAPLGGERGSESVACEAAVLQVAASTSFR